MEMIDVLNADGSPTGVRKPKPEIHRDGDWHLSVHVWIATPGGRLLLQKRSLRKDNNPGLWDVSVAGHVSAGEDAVTSAIREVEEEIGLTVAPADLRYLGRLREPAVLHDGAYIDNEFHDVFLMIRELDLSALVLQDGEVDDVALIDPKDLLTRDDLVPHPAEYGMVVRVVGGG